MSDQNPAQAKLVKFHQLFATPVVVAEVPDAERLNAELKATILGHRAVDPGISRSNVMGWHSKNDMLQWGGDAAQQLAHYILEFLASYTVDTGAVGDEARFAWSGEMWANVNERGGSNQLHAHPGAFWSIAYYVDDAYGDKGPEEYGGELVVEDPAFPGNVMYATDLKIRHPEGSEQQSQQVIPPKSGRFVAFPSWLKHSVAAYRGPGTRISIATNLTVLPVTD
jgi:uncharacterized protein (TIGR02466 family)